MDGSGFVMKDLLFRTPNINHVWIAHLTLHVSAVKYLIKLSMFLCLKYFCSILDIDSTLPYILGQWSGFHWFSSGRLTASKGTLLCVCCSLIA